MNRQIWIKRLIGMDYGLAFRVYLLLYHSKWYIENHHLKDIVAWISKKAIQDKLPTKTELCTARKIVRYTCILAKFVLFDSKCYDKALTVKKILNQKNIPSTLQMGVKISPEKGLQAHAWIKCDEKLLIGKEVASQYTLVQSFS